MILNKKFRKIDVELIAGVAGIIIMSLITIGSATHINTPSEDRYWYVLRQGIFTLLNVGVIFFFMNFDYKALQSYGKKLYI